VEGINKVGVGREGVEKSDGKEWQGRLGWSGEG